MLVAFDDRVQTCIASCAFTRFGADPEPTRWCNGDPGFADLKGLNLAPSLAPMFSNGALAFDWEHICALAAPNPTLIIAGEGDEILPHANSCMEAVDAARRVYEMLNAPEGLLCHVHPEGRTLPREALDVADQWLDRWL
jgi:acetyl esterase/lipase